VTGATNSLATRDIIYLVTYLLLIIISFSKYVSSLSVIHIFTFPQLFPQIQQNVVLTLVFWGKALKMREWKMLE